MASEATARHLMVVDDDDRIRDLLKAFLDRAGYRVTAAPDAAAARRLLGVLQFDLIVLDVMMPGEDGLSLARWLRARRGAAGAAPILFLTARGLAEDRIEGLRLGADDYLAKPFEPEELLLRIAAILRRTRTTAPAGIIGLGVRAFDMGRAELTGVDGPIRLTESEARLMRRLGAAAPEAVDRSSLSSDGSDASGRAVDIQVTRLRRKIEPDPGNPRYLRTVRGVGYALTPD